MPVSLKTTTQNGSALLVVLALIVMLSVLTTLGLGLFKTETPVDRSIETRAKMDHIANQLASYAQNHFRIPCPAKGPDASGFDPALFNNGLEDATNEKCNAPYNGIVPYRTLNLSYQEILDAWGQPISYAVSPVFAETAPQATSQVASFCRTSGIASGNASKDKWVIDSRNDPSDNSILNPHKNINRRKAMFCCPSTAVYNTASDLRLLKPSASGPVEIDPSPYSPASTIRTNIPADFGGLDDATTPAVLPQVRSPETWAFVMISYGENGKNSAAGANETENADSGSATLDRARSFMDAPRNLADGNKYFDDILFYATQDQIMARLNNGSCRTPYFSYRQN